MVKTFFYSSLATSLFMLTACQPTIAPVEQVQQVQITKQESPKKEAQTKVSVAKKQTAMQFKCKDDLLVKVNKPKAKKNANRNSGAKSIIVTYRDSSHTLSPAVSKNGKQYSNIRWTWQEFFDGSAELRDNSGAVLATQCYPQ